MNEPTDTTRQAVTILLVIAAIVTIWLVYALNMFGVVILIILLVACGALALRYQ